MADTVLTLSSERWMDVILMTATVADVADDDFSETFSLPAGIGDVALMEVWLDLPGMTTPISTVELAARLAIFSSNLSTVLDIVGVAKIYKNQALKAAAYFSPDPLVLWRQGEKLNLSGPDLDTGTTADINVYVKCVRVKPVESPPGPIQLVR